MNVFQERAERRQQLETRTLKRRAKLHAWQSVRIDLATAATSDELDSDERAVWAQLERLAGAEIERKEQMVDDDLDRLQVLELHQLAAARATSSAPIPPGAEAAPPVAPLAVGVEQAGDDSLARSSPAKNAEKVPL